MPEVNTLIRPYRPGDEHGLVELFARSFGRSTTEEQWAWKLKSQPTPVENVWLALSADKPVFQYAGIPTRFWLSQGHATAMVSVDTMTAPEFRRRGLLTKVARRVYTAWRDAGIAFVIGLPNQQWGSRTEALGWRALFPLQWLARPLRPEAILARRLKMPALAQVRLPAAAWNRFLRARVRRDERVRTSAVGYADAVFDQLWERCRSGWSFSTIRDRAWVNWRFLESPSRRYVVTLARDVEGPSGYSAHYLTGTGTHAYLAELFVADEDSATRETLLCDMMESVLAAGAEAVFTLAIPGTPLYNCLRRAGFLTRREFTVQVVPLNVSVPFERMLDPGQWNLSGADFDVI